MVRRLKRALLRAAGIVAIVIGIGVFLLTVTVGDCAAFGGTCPRTGGTTADDVIGMGALAGALVGAGLVFAWRPALRSALRAALVAIAAGVVAAFIANGMTSS